MRRFNLGGMMNQNELEEALEVALVDLVDEVEVSPELRSRLVAVLGGEEALTHAIREAQQGQALAQRLSYEPPPARLVEGVLSQARRRRRSYQAPSARVYVELWGLGFLIITLLVAWLSFHTYQRARALQLEGELRPVPKASTPAP